MNSIFKDFDIMPTIVQKIIEVGLIFIVGLIITKVLLFFVERSLDKSAVDKSLHTFVVRAIKVLFIIVIMIMALQMVGVSTNSLVAVLGAGGAAIALALKDSLGNVAGGIMILVTKPFRHNDFIEIKNGNHVSGIVDCIDLLTTTIHTFDNQILTIPNGIISNNVVVNHSMADARRIDCRFSIDYSCDLEKVKEVLLKVAASHEKLYKTPEPWVAVTEVADSSVKMDLKVWCATPDYFDMQFYLQEQVKYAFDREGIIIPFPQMDVHIKNEAL